MGVGLLNPPWYSAMRYWQASQLAIQLPIPDILRQELHFKGTKVFYGKVVQVAHLVDPPREMTSGNVSQISLHITEIEVS